MKKVLVTGENGYIGTKFKEWIQSSNNEIELKYISVRGENWREIDFNGYDAILHLAGIAHVSRNPKFKEMYYQINRDLTVDLAKKAKRENVKQFIFMSSIIVYGDGKLNKIRIDKNTSPTPSNFYGDSKLQAENLIKKLENDKFKISIIRPPMIYGENSKGNYSKLAKLSKISPLFPLYNNERSMLHIDNLMTFITSVISNNVNGVLFPQNKEYINTSYLVQTIAQVHGKKIIMVSGFEHLINKMITRINIFNKLFGTLIYDKELSKHEEIGEYCVNNFYETILKSENPQRGIQK